MDIAVAEEEITRWKVAAQQEADAGKAVEQDFMAQVYILKWLGLRNLYLSNICVLRKYFWCFSCSPLSNFLSFFDENLNNPCVH